MWAAFVKVNGKWRFEGFVYTADEVMSMRKTVLDENGPGSFVAFELDEDEPEPCPDCDQHPCRPDCVSGGGL